MYISRNKKTNLVEFIICKYLTLANEFGTNTNFLTDFWIIKSKQFCLPI